MVKNAPDSYPETEDTFLTEHHSTFSKYQAEVNKQLPSIILVFCEEVQIM
jgi:hypothetical protein